MDMSLSRLREVVMDREGWHVAVHWITEIQTELSNWTELNSPWIEFLFIWNLSKFKSFLDNAIFFLPLRLYSLHVFYILDNLNILFLLVF